MKSIPRRHLLTLWTMAIVLSGLATPIDSFGADEQSPTDGAAARNANLSKRGRRLVDTIKQPVQDQVVDGRLGLFLIDVINSEVKSVAEEPLPGYHHCGSPSWSDDGGQIVFDATPGRSWSKTHLLALGVVNGKRKLTDLGPGNCPALSPDGKRIAFLLNGGAVPGAQPGIWVMNSDGSDRRRLWQGSGNPKWSPDGGRLLIVSFSNPVRLTILDVKTTKTTSVQLAKQSIYSVPSWAGDGRTLVAIIEAGIVLVDVTAPEQARIMQLLWRKGDGPNVTPIHPVYFPESRRCVFVGQEKNGMALYEFQTDQGKTPKRLEPDVDDKRIASLAFSPDGRFVLFCSERLLASPDDRQRE